jgi:hypothetical protein
MYLTVRRTCLPPDGSEINLLPVLGVPGAPNLDATPYSALSSEPKLGSDTPAIRETHGSTSHTTCLKCALRHIVYHPTRLASLQVRQLRSLNIISGGWP